MHACMHVCIHTYIYTCTYAFVRVYTVHMYCMILVLYLAIWQKGWLAAVLKELKTILPIRSGRDAILVVDVLQARALRRW